MLSNKIDKIFNDIRNRIKTKNINESTPLLKCLSQVNGTNILDVINDSPDMIYDVDDYDYDYEF